MTPHRSLFYCCFLQTSPTVQKQRCSFSTVSSPLRCFFFSLKVQSADVKSNGTDKQSFEPGTVSGTCSLLLFPPCPLGVDDELYPQIASCRSR